MQLKISTTRTLPYTYRLQHAGFFAYANLSLTLPTEQHMPENKVLRRIPRHETPPPLEIYNVGLPFIKFYQGEKFNSQLYTDAGFCQVPFTFLVKNKFSRFPIYNTGSFAADDQTVKCDMGWKCSMHTG